MQGTGRALVPGAKRKSSGLVENNQTLGFVSQFTEGTEGCRATEARRAEPSQDCGFRSDSRLVPIGEMGTPRMPATIVTFATALFQPCVGREIAERIWNPLCDMPRRPLAVRLRKSVRCYVPPAVQYFRAVSLALD